jgi:hypothetical protein
MVVAESGCAMGIWSSFVRVGGYLGSPVVVVGKRQDGREADFHVARVQPVAQEIVHAVEAHQRRGRYEPSTLYGDGYVCDRIAAALVAARPYIQKRLAYVNEATRLAVAGD